MNKLSLLILVLLVVGSGFIAKESERTVSQNAFTRGEVLNYKVHYGVINAADAVINIDEDMNWVNNRPCYKATVFGKTTGSFDYFLRIRDTWRTYIDTASILPQHFYQNIEENKYRKTEKITFDHSKNVAVVERIKVKEPRKAETFKIPDNVQDIVSGFYYLRTLDFNKYRNGDVIKVKGFFDNEVFDMDVIFKGRETVATKAGTFQAFKLVPRMPDNKLFAGENAISVYLSDDKNKIPVLIKADMFVGAVKVDLYKYSGLRYKLTSIRNHQ
ncbi:DUF3108 domain-containing protein [Adhaeribacter aquaticus]|uniref:DUF3108 domain-containing protein n=1 Tax=Adhaeribacter aquaticus TaxID=299567 RepID=UPI00041333F5|nr:DUF3108 domain-containing protein [Adhaeribacter aquaticus]